MAKNNEIITAEDLLAKMREGVKAIHEIKLRQFVVQVRVLSIDEMNEVRRDAYKTALASKGDEVDKNLIAQKSILKLASTSQKGGAPMLSDKLLGMLTTDEINFLYDEYMTVLDRVNPALEKMNPEVFRELVDSLKKNLLSVNDLSLQQLKVICSAYVEMISRKDS